MVEKGNDRASLVAKWCRIHLPFQETWIRSLVLEDPTCLGETKPSRHTNKPVPKSPGTKTTEACES